MLKKLNSLFGGNSSHKSVIEIQPEARRTNEKSDANLSRINLQIPEENPIESDEKNISSEWTTLIEAKFIEIEKKINKYQEDDAATKNAINKLEEKISGMEITINDLLKEKTQVHESEFAKFIKSVLPDIPEDAPEDAIESTSEDMKESAPEDISEDIAKPDNMPVWLYEVIIRNVPKEQEIMMNQLVLNQALEFYITSQIEPETEHERNEKKYLLQNYNPFSALDGDCFEKVVDGIVQTTKDICVGRICGKYCQFSTNDLPAKKLCDLIDQGNFGQAGMNTKYAYYAALEKHKNKYNVTMESFGERFVPEHALEHSNQNMNDFWKRVQIILS